MFQGSSTTKTKKDEIKLKKRSGNEKVSTSGVLDFNVSPVAGEIDGTD